MDADLESRIQPDLEGQTYILQVPHHGGKSNWKSMDESLWSKAEGLVFSYGVTNSYHHPDGVCFHDIIQKKYPWYKIHLVYEDNSFDYDIIT